MSNQIVPDDQPITDQAVNIVTDYLIMLRKAGRTKVGASEVANYYSFPKSFIQKIFNVIAVKEKNTGRLGPDLRHINK